MNFNIEQSLDGFEVLPVDVRRNCLLMMDLDSRVEILKRDVEHLKQECRKKMTTMKRQERCRIYREFKEKHEKMQAYADDKIQLANQNLALVNKLIRKADLEYARFKSQLEDKTSNVAAVTSANLKSPKGTCSPSSEVSKKETAAENGTEVTILSFSKRKSTPIRTATTHRKSTLRGIRKRSTDGKQDATEPHTKLTCTRRIKKGGDDIRDAKKSTIKDEKPAKVEVEPPEFGRGQRRKSIKSSDVSKTNGNVENVKESPVKVGIMRRIKKGDAVKAIMKEAKKIRIKEKQSSPARTSDRKKSRKDSVQKKSWDKEKLAALKQKSVLQSKEKGSSIKSANQKNVQKKGTAAVTSDTTTKSLKHIYSSHDIDMPVYPNEPTYCLCNQVSFGKMIGCDNLNCPIEWFHFDCLKLTTKPKGKWYCPQCRVSMKKK